MEATPVATIDPLAQDLECKESLNNAIPLVEESKTSPHSRKHLTDEERRRVILFLLDRRQNGKLSYGVLKIAATEFKVSPCTVSRLWSKAKDKVNRGAAEDWTQDVVSKMKGSCGKKPKDYSKQLDLIRNIPADKRGSLRTLCREINVSRSTLHNLLKDGQLKRVFSRGKPLLTIKKGSLGG